MQAAVAGSSEMLRLEGERESLRAQMKKDPTLAKMLPVYDQMRKRFRGDLKVILFVDPNETVACPRCNCLFPAGIQGALANPAAWCQCSDCEVILIGALKFMRERRPA